MTTTTATPLPLSPAGEYTQTVEYSATDRRTGTYRKHLVDEHLIVNAYGTPHRVAEVHVNVADPTDVKIVLLRQKARGGDYKRPVGTAETAADIRANHAAFGVALVRILARAEAAVAPAPAADDLTGVSAAVPSREAGDAARFYADEPVTVPMPAGLLTEFRAHGGHVHTRDGLAVSHLPAHMHDGVPPHTHGAQGTALPFGGAADVALLVADIEAAYEVTGGREGFLADPGGWIDYLGFTDSEPIAAAAIELIREGAQA